MIRLTPTPDRSLTDRAARLAALERKHESSSIRNSQFAIRNQVSAPEVPSASAVMRMNAFS